jgi:glycerol-3-phosphate acyltransferase PlsY
LTAVNHPAVLSWLIIPVAYLLGSLSAAYWAARLKGIDLRKHGSGNLGATNAGRVLGGRWFAIVFSADVLKGLAPVAVAHQVPLADEAQRGWLLVATAAAAVLGLSLIHI